MDSAALEGLAAETKAADAEPIPPAESATATGAALAAPAGPADLAREWAELPAAVGAGLSLLAPELSQVYTDAACLKWGKAMVPIAARYGWTPGKWWPWLELIVATGALLGPTVMVFRARIAQAQQAAAEASQPKPDAPAPAS
jgi:hypothetical protein